MKRKHLNGCGCCSAPTVGTYNVTAKGCTDTYNCYGNGTSYQIPVPGATVTMTSGTNSYSGVTDANGLASIGFSPANLNWTVTVTPPAGSHYDPITFTSGFLSAGTSSTTRTVNPSTGYSCTRFGCCPDNPPCYPPYTFAPTLYYSDGLGPDVPLTKTSSNVWSGCGERTAAVAYLAGCTNASKPTGTNLTVRMNITFTCSTGLWSLGIGILGCGGCAGACTDFPMQSDCSTPLITQGGNVQANGVAATSCFPFLWTATASTPNSGTTRVGHQIFGDTANWTIYS